MAKGKQSAVGQQQQPQQPKGKIHHLNTTAVKTTKKSGGSAVLSAPAQQSATHRETVEGILESNKSSAPIKIENAETDGEGDEVKPKQQNAGGRDSTISNPNYPEKSGGGWGNTGRGGGRFIIKNLWEVCCNETESESNELDTILKKLGLPSINYSKTKAYEMTDYEIPPDIQNCKSKDFLDFYVFPYLLPAIQALIQFARVNRVFQCRFCTFNALDYIVEYLYNNNPRYPERFTNPTPIFEIPFARAWLEKHPRMPPPKWMLMSSEEAAIIIQRAIRGYMVRCRPDVQEMRQFWKEFRKDLEEERSYYQYGKILPKAVVIYSPYYEEYRGEFDEACESPCVQPLQQPMDGIGSLGPGVIPGPIASPSLSHHSDHCLCCQAFRRFLESQPDDVLKSYQRPSSMEILSANEDSTRLSSVGNEEEGYEGLNSDTGGENEENSGKERNIRKESGINGAQQQGLDSLLPTTPSKMKAQKAQAASVAQKSFTMVKPKPEKKSKKHD